MFDNWKIREWILAHFFTLVGIKLTCGAISMYCQDLRRRRGEKVPLRWFG